MGSGLGEIYENDRNDSFSKEPEGHQGSNESKASERTSTSTAPKGTLEGNIEAVRKKFNLNEDGYFGEPGNKHWVRVIESDNPTHDAKELFELLSSGGKDCNLAEGIDGVRELADGTRINYRLITKTPDSPAVEISNPGTALVKKQKIHFIKRGFR